MRAAAGGGLIKVATVYPKFPHLRPAPRQFIEGLPASFNYAGSFPGHPFRPFLPLATKQPAMTGPALAHRLDAVGRSGKARGVRR
ncbi:hypothetical protein ACTMU2_08590 [Cupriavidus basilensis]